jgi:cell wall-associated NlpC family hydrolase
MLTSGRHTRLMRRGVLLALLAGVAALVAAALSSGSEPKPRAAAKPPVAKETAELPPLPEKMRPKVVEPVAGNGGSSPDAAVTDPGLSDVGPAPTGPASAGTPRRGGAGSTDITKATALANGVALPPLEAPEEVKQIIEAGNIIARSPYVWGGGHGKWLDKGYDCSGSVSFALAAAGLLNGPLASGPLMSWGKAGPGRWVTIYSSPGHVFMYVAGIRFDTSGQRVTGSRWQNELRSTAGFVARHPEGL